MDEAIFEAYVTNLGKYNEGELVGEWVKFPTTSEEMKKVFDRIGINAEYEEIFITDYDTDLYNVTGTLGGYPSLDKLNYLAGVLAELSTEEREKYEAVLESGLSLGQEGIDGLINLAYNLDNYDLFAGVEDEDDLGRYYVELMYGDDLEKQMGQLSNYIDYESYGRDIQINEAGMFTDAGYMRDTGNSWDEYFDGTLEDIPDEYRLNSGEEHEMDNKMTVLVVEPQKKPYLQEITHDLKTLQKMVDGGIEGVYPFEDRVAIICNDEHKFNGSELNRCIRDDKGEVYDILAGTFLVAGLTEFDFGSLSPELADKYMKYFETPEMFVQMGDTLMVLPMDETEIEKQHQATQEQAEAATYSIYQLKDGEGMRDYHFTSMDTLKKMGLSVDVGNYEKVYEAPKTSEDTLDSIYYKFNMEHPADFRGHSLSVSDVIVFHENGVDTAHYVDSFGFEAVPDFLTQKAVSVNMDTFGLSVEGHDGTWHSIEELAVQGNAYFLMESEAFGQDANMIVVDHAGQLIAEDITTMQRANAREIVLEVLNQEIEDKAASLSPDKSITQKQMVFYGYDWGGMLPVREQNAEKLYDAGIEVFALHSDNTEASLDSKDLIAEHGANGGIFGVEKVAWAKFIDTNSLKKVEELLEDDYGMIDGIINNGSKSEREEKDADKKSSVRDKLKEKQAEVEKHDVTVPKVKGKSKDTAIE